MCFPVECHNDISMKMINTFIIFCKILFPEKLLDYVINIIQIIEFPIFVTVLFFQRLRFDMPASEQANFYILIKRALLCA